MTDDVRSLLITARETNDLAARLRSDADDMEATDRISPFGVQLPGEDVVRLVGLLRAAESQLTALRQERDEAVATLRRLRTHCYECRRAREDDWQTPANAECIRCGELDCPHGEALHYHHDGCPACIEDPACPPKDARIVLPHLLPPSPTGTGEAP